MKTSIYNIEWHCYRVSQDSGLSSSDEYVNRGEEPIPDEEFAIRLSQPEPDSHHASFEQQVCNQETTQEDKKEILVADSLWKRLSPATKVSFDLFSSN
jgi:hypothetical protein